MSLVVSRSSKVTLKKLWACFLSTFSTPLKGERGPRGAPGPPGDNGVGFPGAKVN